MSLLPVASLMASRKNRTVRDRKITCMVRFNLSVEMNMKKVNRPHMTR